MKGKVPLSILPTFFALLFIFVWSCKTTEKIPEARLKPMSPARILKNVSESAFDYAYFSVRRVNVVIDDGESKTSFRAGLQAIKDREIQISVTKFNIPLGRISLTPDSILFVNYIERSYISDDYKALSNLFDFDLDFRSVQAILSGNIFSFFDDEDDARDYRSSIDLGMYMLQSEKIRKLRKIDQKGKVQKIERIMRRIDEDALVVNTFYFDPELFVLKKMILEDKTNKRKAQLLFNDYNKVGQKYYPGSIDVSFDSEEGRYRVEARMSGFSTERGELTPVRIPERYQRLYLY